MEINYRSIPFAINGETGEFVSSDILFKDTKKAHIERAKYAIGSARYICCECSQDLVISKSIKDKVYFKHKPGHDYCTLTNSKFTSQELIDIGRSYYFKESERHKTLKNKIGEQLRKTSDVVVSSVTIDSKFISDGIERRKPDVYCKYKDKQLAFEIQLSDLSLKYILGRSNFYKSLGIYLIWIIDDLDILIQKRMEKDLKYLSKNQNFFSLNEESEYLVLKCNYKYHFVSDKNTVHSKWTAMDVSLPELKYDDDLFQVYFYDLDKNYKEKEIEAEDRRIAEEDQKAKEYIDSIFYEIKKNRKNYYANLIYEGIIERLSDLTESQINVVRAMRLNSPRKEDGRLPLTALIDRVNKDEAGAFLQFLISKDNILFDINNQDNDGRTVLQAILMNNEICYKYGAILDLIENGYYFTDSDEQLLLNLEVLSVDLWFFKMCSEHIDLIPELKRHKVLISILDSSTKGKIMGSKVTNWAAYFNNILQYHSKYWERYIKPAFDKTDILSKAIKENKKGTILKKITELQGDVERISEEESREIDMLIYELYQRWQLL